MGMDLLEQFGGRFRQTIERQHHLIDPPPPILHHTLYTLHPTPYTIQGYLAL